MPALRPSSPSPRSSPALRPSSPLSTGYKASSHFEMLQPPSPRLNATQTRPSSSSSTSGNTSNPNTSPSTTSWRAHRGSLRLPGLPRYHPANFASSYSSLQPTPEGSSSSSSPQPPTSPRAYQKLYSDAQKQLFSHQRGMVSAAQHSSAFAAAAVSLQDGMRPSSPRLAPLGSPGPVTPLTLEQQQQQEERGGYLLAGAAASRSASANASAAAVGRGMDAESVVDSLIREEALRRGQTAGQVHER